MKEASGNDYLTIAWAYPGKSREVIPANFSRITDPTSCTGMMVEVKVQTDDYPDETAWTLINKCSPGITVSSPRYSWGNVMRSTTKCLPKGKYEFTITDTFDDGICCNYGQGGYEILVDGVSVHTGDQFGTLETKTIGACPTSEFAVTKVRVKLDRQDYLHMREVQVFDRKNVNAALEKPANQSSTWPGYPASNALNDIMSDMSHTGFDSGKCHHPTSTICSLVPNQCAYTYLVCL